MSDTPPTLEPQSPVSISQDVAIAPSEPGVTTFERDIISPHHPTSGLAFSQLLNLSIGFFGIQFAWMIQIMRTTPFLESLGSNAAISGVIWWAGPITGILVQPIVGSLSDRTRSRLGRRRPFLIAGMISTALWLVAMPNSPTLLVAAMMLWLLDASINITQGPYRALVPDVVPKHQHATTFAFMSFFIGLGSIAASYVGSLDVSLNTLFYIGAVAMLAFMTWTMLTTKEPKLPPVAPVGQDSGQIGVQKRGLEGIVSQTLTSIAQMPIDAKKLCLVHSLTWFGWQCMFIFFSVFVAHQIFGATDPQAPLYQAGLQYAATCFLIWNVVNVVASLAIPYLLKVVSRKAIHTVGLLFMGAGLVSMHFLSVGTHVAMAMGLLGLGWATTLSIPFAMMASHIKPGQEGVMMGTFNIFIAAPQIVASALAGYLVFQTGLDSSALILGGGAVLIAALLLQWVNDRPSSAVPGHVGH